MKALVIGGGVGGLAAAAALRRAGHDVAVFEQAERFTAVGAGLAVSANALTALSALGLRDRAVSCGSLASRLLLRTSRGGTLADVRLGNGEESLGIHRAELLAVLLDGAGEPNVHLARRCVRVEQDATGATAVFADGSSARGDFLIGADGIDSVVRTRLFGPMPRRYAGYIGWRAVAALPGPIEPGVFWETWGRGVRFGFVDIGRGRAYWFVSESAPEGAQPSTQPKQGFLARFREWHEPVEAIVEATPDEALHATRIYDRKPIARWTEGRIGLLGDAAHAMTPNLGQGASQALEDAAVLGLASTHADPIVLLKAYERRRVARATAIVRRSWQAGRLAQARNPAVCAARTLLLRGTPRRVQQAQQRRLLTFEM